MPRTNKLFLAITEQVRAQLRSTLQPGERLPSSRALAGSYGVSRTLIQRVLGLLEQEGMVQIRDRSGVIYKGVSPRTKARPARKLSICAITKLTQHEHDVAANELHGLLQKEARARGHRFQWSVNPHSGRQTPARDLIDLDRVPWNDFDVGLLLEVDQAEILNDPRMRKEKLIAVDQDATRFGIASVCFDDFGAGALAAQYLHRLGHRRFAVTQEICEVGFPPDPAHVARRQGFEWMAERLCGTVRPAWRIEVPYIFASVRKLVPTTIRFMQPWPEWPIDRRPTALFTASGFRLPEILGELVRAGVQTPRDLSIVGTHWHHPYQIPRSDTGTGEPLSLTHVHLDLHGLVRRALDVAEAWCRGGKRKSIVGSSIIEGTHRFLASMVLKKGASTSRLHE